MRILAYLRGGKFMKKRLLLIVALVVIVSITFLAFPGSISAITDGFFSEPHVHYSISSSPFNEPITIDRDYYHYADALNAAKNMAHDAM
jgi:hypothetical protein